MQVVYSGRFNGRRPEKLRAVNGEVKPGTREYLLREGENFEDWRGADWDPGRGRIPAVGFGMDGCRDVRHNRGCCPSSHPCPQIHE